MKKLLINNNWERYEYFINPDDDVYINPFTIKEVIVNGKKYPVKAISHQQSYYDMGLIYHTTQTELFIEVEGFSVNLSRAMQDKRVDVYIENDNYKTYEGVE